MTTCRADMLAGFTVALAGAGLFALTFGIRETEAGLIGASFFPRVSSGVLIALGLALALAARRDPASAAISAEASDAERDDVGEPASSLSRGLVLPAIGFIYVLAMPWIGYLLSTLVAGWAALVLFGARPGRAALIAMAASVAMYLLFAGAMGLFMPRGRLLDAAAWLPV